MAIAVEMPKMSDTMEEGVLVSWLVEEGATVEAGDVIANVETDKATMDLEVYDDGVLLKRVIAEGAAVPIGALIAVLGKQGEDPGPILAKYDGSAPAAAASPAAVEEVAEAPASAPETIAAPVSDERVKSSPLARKMAEDHGLSLSTISGTGPEGRIVRRDIEAVLGGASTRVSTPAAAPPVPVPVATPVAAPAPAKIPDGATYEAIRLSQMRKTISRRLAESKFTAPHFYLKVTVDMDKAAAMRAELNERAVAQQMAKVSFNDLVTKACARALTQHPYVNGSYMEAEGEIRLHQEVHVAVAVAVDEGLVTPVIRHADRKGLSQIAEETRALATKARDKALQPEDYAGSTFTTSNLGMFGIDEFSAIINPPNAAILAIGAIREVPVVRDGALATGKRMTISLSCDHRIVDGAVGAAFLNAVQGYLEDPLTMLL
jgi:pyruvate dehydrogenase E2 component (dihydrolipoamide acetyltransferase)